MLRISLLHATHRSGPPAVAVRDLWLERAVDATRIEHIFAADADDEISLACPEIANAVIGTPMPGLVTAVRNWNAAAEIAAGDLLMVIADDLLPPLGWDIEVESLCVDLDPRRAAFVVDLKDHEADSSGLIRHPVISWRYYERFGLWHPEYTGHLVDNDFTWSAHRRNVVIGGGSFTLDHRSPLLGAPATESHLLMLTSKEHGKKVLARRWPLWKRRLVRWPLRPRKGQVTIGPLSQLGRGLVARQPHWVRRDPQLRRGGRVARVGRAHRARRRGQARRFDI